MKLVQPIKDKNLINEIKNYLRIKNYRNYILFLMGINTGLRISNIIALKVEDVMNKTHVLIKLVKTGKPLYFCLNDNVILELKKYIGANKLTLDDYLFTSKKRDQFSNKKPIQRIQAHYIMKDIEKEFKILHFGCHSMRKTFGYHFYKKEKDIVTLMKIFGHSSQGVTLRYIGIDQDEIDKKLSTFHL